MKVIVWCYSFDGWDEVDSRSREVFEEINTALKRAKELEEELKRAPRYEFCYGPYFIEVKVVDKGDEKILRKAEIGYYYNDPSLHVNVEVNEGGE